MANTGSPQDDKPFRRRAVLGSLWERRIVRQLVGIGLLFLGLAGLVLPILPGWVFIAWGVVTLAPDIPFFGRLLDRLAQRVPQLSAAIDRVRSDRHK